MRYLAFAALMLSGCGYIGDPQPPALNIPVAVGDLRALEYGENLVVEFTAPALSTEALTLDRLRGAEIRVGPWPAGPDVAAWMAAARVFALPVDQPGAVTKSIPVEKEWIGKEVLILARTAGPKGRWSPDSNLLFLMIEPPLAKPGSLRAENHPEGVRLTWTGTAAKYRVLRATEDAAPVAIGEVEGREFVDKTSIYGIRYGYVVQALGEKAQSEVTGRAEVTPVDVFAPAVPSGLSSVAGPAAIDLAWERNTETDFKLYRIFRAVGGGGFELLAEVDTPSYVDRAVEAGKRYRYQVSAVDRLGNESKPSTPVEVVLP